MPLYPLLLEPTLLTKVWGGRRLETVMGKTLPTAEPYGESWELHDTSKIINGEYAGRTLGDLLKEFGASLIGAHNDPAKGLPLLVKIIDASEWLSVQVHPNDEQAANLEGQPRGKTEGWIVLAAEKKDGKAAQLILGVKPGTSRDALAQAIRADTLKDLLVYADVDTGDVLYMPAGTVHALGPGLLIYEVQQSSDTTYRLYDWGRMGLDGKPRDLHIDKAVQVANVETLPIVEHTPTDKSLTEVVRGAYFTTVIFNITDQKPLQFFMHREAPHRHFHALTCVEGALSVEAIGIAASGPITDSRRLLGPRVPSVNVEKGQTVMIPASFDMYRLTARTPAARVLCSFQSSR
jgi:mannose-6-phosphate isomerase